MESTVARSYPSYLEHDQQRQVADQYVSPAINQSGITSADKYYNWLRDRDFGVTRAVVRQSWNEYNRAMNYIDVINAWPKEHALPRAWYAETDRKMQTAYSYTLGYQLTDLFTGDSTTSYYTVSSRTRQNVKQMIDAFANDFEEYGMAPSFAASDFYVDVMYHKKGAAW